MAASWRNRGKLIEKISGSSGEIISVAAAAKHQARRQQQKWRRQYQTSASNGIRGAENRSAHQQ